MSPKNREELREFLAAIPRYSILEALDQEGLAIVPKEPTTEMKVAGACVSDPEFVPDVYAAMLAASPYSVKP